MSEHDGVHKWACFLHHQFLNQQNIIQFAGKLGIADNRGHSKAISTHDKKP